MIFNDLHTKKLDTNKTGILNYPDGQLNTRKPLKEAGDLKINEGLHTGIIKFEKTMSA